MRMPRNADTRCWLGALALALVVSVSAHAQGAGGPVVSDTRVGYIDGAIPATQLRFRFDAAYDNRTAARAEYFYARPRPLGPGLMDPEPRIDYQDIDVLAEYEVRPGFSVFAETPLRFLNPQVNANATGLADIKIGFKWVVWQSCASLLTAQLRTYLPTGDAARGLGTEHFSLEPGLLAYHRLGDRLALEGEVKLWTPLGGTDFAGEVLRYGLGFNYDLGCIAGVGVAPVVEFVGWTALDGKVSEVTPGGVVVVDNAAGDTIINVKVGARFRLTDHADCYIGYGRSLTGDRWYEDIARIEFRVFR